MKTQIILAFSCVAVVLGAVGCGRSDKKSNDDLGTSLGNALVLGMAKDQYTKAKAAYDKGDDASLECIMDTSELKKDKSPEAQQLAKDTDRLCEVDVPARAAIKDLDKELADVTAGKTDKTQTDMLKSRQVLLGFSCDHAKEKAKAIKDKNLTAEPNAKALDTKIAAVCTPENLEGGPVKVAKGKR